MTKLKKKMVRWEGKYKKDIQYRKNKRKIERNNMDMEEQRVFKRKNGEDNIIDFYRIDYTESKNKHLYLYLYILRTLFRKTNSHQRVVT